MKKWYLFLCISAFCFFYLPGLSQFNEDSVMLAHSEKWKVKANKGLFGLSKPDFGVFTTLDVVKIDSPVIKKKTKDSSYIGAEFSGEGIDMDQRKFMTIEKRKFYKLQLATNADTTEAVFSIASVSKEKRQTFLGKLLSKNDDGKDALLSYNRDVPGIIVTGVNSMQWEFLIVNFTSGSRQTESNPYPSASISGGYLKNDLDSLYMQIYSSFSADLVLVNKSRENLAALNFKQKPLYIWIRNDIEDSY